MATLARTLTALHVTDRSEVRAVHVRAFFNGNGVLDDETALRGMELFAREVLPVCRAIERNAP